MNKLSEITQMLSDNYFYLCSIKKTLKKIEFKTFVNRRCKEDHRIGDQILLMDEYQLGPVCDYEFCAPENIFVEVLSGMNMSVLEVAQSLNFSGLPQFCKFFRKHTGLTPTGFRKSLL